MGAGAAGGARHVLLLRGINVGGRNRVPMAQLRAMLEARGLHDVRTYLQSGNVVASGPLASGAAAQVCREAIAAEFGLDIRVLARTAEELAAVLAADPLGHVAEDPKRYLVSFLTEALPEERVERLRAQASPGEQLVALGRELYSWHPAGIGRSRLWEAAARLGTGAREGVSATARNWSTVNALAAMV